MNFTFGSDPEFFLSNSGKLVSAIEIINGDVDHRISISGHEFYYDNVLAECAIKPGANKKETLQNIRECLKIYANMVRPNRLETIASHTFSKEELDHPAARKVGCAPDMCAYEVAQVKPPRNAIKKSGFRSSGGHIHLGSDILLTDGPEPYFLVYMLDLFVAGPSLKIDKDPTSPARRTLYGQAGRFRSKEYGLEYRTLSSFWLKSPRLVKLVYDLCNLSLEIIASGKINELWKFDLDTFFESEQLKDAFTCHGYDAVALKKGIDAGNSSAIEQHIQLAKNLMPSQLKEELEELEQMNCGDLYSEWGL